MRPSRISQIFKVHMKRINYRRLGVLGGILSAILAAGCFGGGRGYSNNPFCYNSGYYSSTQYTNPYGNPYPYNSGYNSSYNDEHWYPQSYRNSYSVGHPDGLRAEASRDRHEDRTAEQHVARDRDRGQARNETHHRSERN